MCLGFFVAIMRWLHFLTDLSQVTSEWAFSKGGGARAIFKSGRTFPFCSRFSCGYMSLGSGRGGSKNISKIEISDGHYLRMIPKLTAHCLVCVVDQSYSACVLNIQKGQLGLWTFYINLFMLSWGWCIETICIGFLHCTRSFLNPTSSTFGLYCVSTTDCAYIACIYTYFVLAWVCSWMWFVSFSFVA